MPNNELGPPPRAIAGGSSKSFRRTKRQQNSAGQRRLSTSTIPSLFGVRCTACGWRPASILMAVRNLYKQGTAQIGVCRICWPKLSDQSGGGSTATSITAPLIINATRPPRLAAAKGGAL